MFEDFNAFITSDICRLTPQEIAKTGETGEVKRGDS